MADEPRKLPAVFYRSVSGREPAREWLKDLGQDDRRYAGHSAARFGKCEAICFTAESRA